MAIEAGTVRDTWDSKRGGPSTDPTCVRRAGTVETVTLQGNGLALEIAQKWLLEFARRERLAANGGRSPFEASANAACCLATAIAQALAPLLSSPEPPPAG